MSDEKQHPKELAAAKRAAALKWFQEGVTPAEVRRKVHVKFGVGIANDELYRLHREVKGLQPRQRKKRASKRKRKRKAVQKKQPKRSSAAQKFEAIPVPKELATVSPSQLSAPMQAALNVVLQLLRVEGLEGITLYADKRCCVHRLATQTLELE